MIGRAMVRESGDTARAEAKSGFLVRLWTHVPPALWSFLGALLVFAVAFPPRVVRFVDSSMIWQSRARAFMEALETGDWSATLQAPHPGVTTMWLAGLARQVSLAFVPDFDDLSLVEQSQIELIPIAFVVSAGIACAFLLLARLLGRRVAMVTALLLALDPCHIALSKAVHVDALLSVFCMLSALCMWMFVAFGAWRYVALSGALAALALLSKTPAVFLVPYFGLTLLVWGARAWSDLRRPLSSTPRWRGLFPLLRKAGTLALIWALAFVATYWLIWPSMWTQPGKTLAVTFGGATYYRDTPHENPVLFLGKVTNQDPGPLFYPVNMAIKSTGVTLVGFVAGLVLLFRRGLPERQRLTLWLGLAFVVGFTAQMTLGQKKFDRYALPALQFIVILAGAGWVYGLERLIGRRTHLLTLALCAVLALQGAVSIPRHPYYGTHYNYLLGGPRWILEHNVVAGQEHAEGLEIAAEYLNALPLSKLLVVGAQSFGGFYHHFQGKTVPLTDDRVDYVLFTRAALVRRMLATAWQAVWETYRDRQPKLVVRFDGVPYVWVYKTGPIVEDDDIPYRVDATVGTSLRLLGYDMQPERVQAGEIISLTLYWEALSTPAGDYTVFVHLLDPVGEIRGQKDNPPQNAMYPTYLWDAGDRVVDEYQIVVHPDAPAGSYTLAVGMYTLQTMERLPVATRSGDAPPDHRLLLPGPQVRAR